MNAKLALAGSALWAGVLASPELLTVVEEALIGGERNRGWLDVGILIFGAYLYGLVLIAPAVAACWMMGKRSAP